MSQNYTLITGASRGIGKALAIEAAKRGQNLILVARSKEQLDELVVEIRSEFGVEVVNYIVDLTKTGASEEILKWCEHHNYKVDILINNAGLGLWGDFSKLSLDKQLGIVDLNIKSVLSMTYTFIPMLKESSQSYILNIGSIASFVPSPFLNVYAATKAFILSFSRALRFELKDTSIEVSCLCPGGTHSDFWETAGMAEVVKNNKMMTAEEVAEIAFDQLFKADDVIVPGGLNSLYTFIGKNFPLLVINAFGRLMSPRRFRQDQARQKAKLR